MISAFDIGKLRDLLRDFHEITKIRITVFDENMTELVSYPEELAPICKIVRDCEAGWEACRKCDRQACDCAAATRKTQIYRCHAGLTEAVSPLIVNDVLVGYLLFGHVLSYPDHAAGWQAISRCTTNLPVDPVLLRGAVERQPLIPEAYVQSATHIMSAVASYLVMERLATLQSDQTAVQLDRYLSEHFTEEFTAPELAARFSMGKTRLYQISRQLYGCGIAEHVRRLRIGKAKELLRTEPKLSLSEIAERCGFQDDNYFISVFSRMVGCPPRRWQALPEDGSGSE